MRDDLTTEELAKRWSMNPGTLRNWRVAGIGPKFISLGRTGKGRRPRIRYKIADIKRYEKSQRR